MTLNEVLDMLAGTPHYDPFMDSVVRRSFSDTMQKKAHLKEADNLDTEKFNGSGAAKKPTKKKNSTPPQLPICQLGFKNGFVYADGDTGLYVKVNNQNGGKNSVTVIGYDKENANVEEAAKKDQNWFDKYLSKTALTSIKATHRNTVNAYLRSMDKWVEVGTFSTFKNEIPSSFVALGDFAKESIFDNREVVEADAQTAELDPGVQLSMAS